MILEEVHWCHWKRKKIPLDVKIPNHQSNISCCKSGTEDNKKRLKTRAREFSGNDQFGFRKERGTREAIEVMRCLVERKIEFNNDLYMCFVDYEKAFDYVDWKKLMMILE